MDRIVRVLVVDDSAYVRKVVRQMLSRSPFLEVVGAARDGAEALELVEQLRPDVVTLDLNMPELDGLDFLRRRGGAGGDTTGCAGAALADRRPGDRRLDRRAAGAQAAGPPPAARLPG